MVFAQVLDLQTPLIALGVIVLVAVGLALLVRRTLRRRRALRRWDDDTG